MCCCNRIRAILLKKASGGGWHPVLAFTPETIDEEPSWLVGDETRKGDRAATLRWVFTGDIVEVEYT